VNQAPGLGNIDFICFSLTLVSGFFRIVSFVLLSIRVVYLTRRT